MRMAKNKNLLEKSMSYAIFAGNKNICSLLERFVLFFLCVLLTGCSVFRGDYAPPYDIDVSRIPDAVPKWEPKNPRANPVSYKVYGKRYVVLKSVQGYVAEGYASWYGMKFHRKKTASGELYEVTKMTAAHRTLPIPSYVRVTNLRNHKKIIVRVNDRGPFVKNRLIDLSYVAAKKLGISNHGTAKVRVEGIAVKK